MEFNPENIIPLVLQEFQSTLRSLRNEYGNIDSYGLPPAEFFIEYNAAEDNFAQDDSYILKRWQVTLDQLTLLPDDTQRPINRDPQNVFFKQGLGYFSVNQQVQIIWLGWVVGPRFGRGYCYSLGKSSTGEICLVKTSETWAS